MKTTAFCLALAIAAGGCANLAPTLQAAADGARATAKAASGGDDRTAAARIGLGIAIAQSAVTLGCTMVNDAANVDLFSGLRSYCAARR